MNKKALVTLLILCLTITGASSIFAAKRDLPMKSETPKWAVELDKSKQLSPHPDKFTSYKLLVTNTSKDTIKVTFELYRPVVEDHQEQIILIDPTSYETKPNETVTFNPFYIDNRSEELEVVLFWNDGHKRKHKQSIKFTDFK